MPAPSDVKEVVREKYGQAALQVKAGQSGCSGRVKGWSKSDRP